MSSQKHTKAVNEIAASQMGLFTTAQAERFGVSRNVIAYMAKTSKIERIEQGVYRIAGMPFDEKQGIYAVWLGTNPRLMAYERSANFDGIVVGGRSAAACYGVGDFFLSPYRFLVRNRINSKRQNVIFTISKVGESDIVRLDGGLPVTSITRTLYDLAMDYDDSFQVEQIIYDTIKNNLPLNVERLLELKAEKSRRGRYDFSGIIASAEKLRSGNELSGTAG